MGMRYMDDIRILMKAIKEGWRWENGRLKFKKCWQQEELREGISREKKTSRDNNKSRACLRRQVTQLRIRFSFS